MPAVNIVLHLQTNGFWISCCHRPMTSVALRFRVHLRVSKPTLNPLADQPSQEADDPDCLLPNISIMSGYAPQCRPYDKDPRDLGNLRNPCWLGLVQ